MSVLLSALNTMSDEELRALLHARPDAAFPTPPSLAALASRLSLPGSLSRALRRLTAPEIAVLETLGDAGAELSPVALDSVSLPFDPRDCITRLRTHGLLLGPDDALHVAPGVLSVLPPGWRILDPAPAGLEDSLAQISPRERRVLDTLAASGSVGTTRAAAPDADPALPVPRLISLGLLVRVNSTTVRLPRPVKEALRGGSARTYPLEMRPQAQPVAPEQVASAATAAGLDSVRRMRQLLTHLIATPIALNRDGSIGVRAHSAVKKALDFDPALSVTIGEAAGLIGRGPNREDTEVLAATRDGLTWLDVTLAEQWAVLLAGWLASPWRTDTDARLLSEDTHAPEIRSARLGVLTRFARGPLTRAELDTDLHHFSPILASGLSASLIDATVTEGHTLGALAVDTAAPPLTAHLTGEDIIAATRALVPEETNRIIAQADLTVLAPGPLTPEMTSMLESFAELESPGVASVYRVTEASVRRALAQGRTAAELSTWLSEHVIGEVPQGLSFLIEDTARHNGALRAGAVASYLRCNDEALLATAAASLPELRLLAPTVAVSELALPKLTAQLRAKGFQPAAEDASGATITAAEEPELVSPTPSTIPQQPSISQEHVNAVLGALRSGSADQPDEQGTLATLHAAARARRHVTIAYVDKNGRERSHTVLPLTVSAGQVDALDEASDRVVRIALPRVTRVEVRS